MPESIVCQCSNCDAKLRLKDPSLAGRKIRCPKCAEPFVVSPIDDSPSASPMPSKKAKPAAPPEDDDWLSDLGEASASEDALPPVVNKKKKKASVPQEVRERKRSEQGRDIPLPVHYLMMAGTGLLGGLVGAAIWAGLIYMTGIEIGYVAILVGAAAGIGVRLGANEWDYGLGPGLLAVAVAIVALIGGKIVGGRMYLQAELREIQNIAVQWNHDNHLIAEFAQEIWEEAPEDAQFSEPELGEDGADESELSPDQIPKGYPKEVWAQALARWNGMTEEEKQKLRDEQIKGFDEEFEVPAHVFFGPIDILWFVLAVSAAFRIATGAHE